MEIAVIGGGAAGMMAAVTAAKHEACHVIIYERNEKLGKKILSTGNGKCNFSHSNITGAEYGGSVTEYLSEIFGLFSQERTLEFFAENGFAYREKNGYYYPYSEQASAMLDFWKSQIGLHKIGICYQCVIDRIQPLKQGGYQLFDSEGKCYSADRIILSVGGMAAPKTGSDGNMLSVLSKLGIELTPCYPALSKVKCGEKYCKNLSGIRTLCNVTLLIDGERIGNDLGEVQFTDDGLSGIPVFQISREVGPALSKNKSCEIILDLFPDLTEAELLSRLVQKQKLFPAFSWNELLNSFLPWKAVPVLLGCVGVNTSDPVTASKIEELASFLKQVPFTVKEIYGYEFAQVTRGGVHARSITKSLESKQYPGLYFCGEILDIDGICGGYNLQWCWSSGFVAGTAATNYH